MKTIIIYSSLEDDLLFSILEGDYSHLNKCFINSGLDTKKKNLRLASFFMTKKVILEYLCLMMCLLLNQKTGIRWL